MFLETIGTETNQLTWRAGPATSKDSRRLKTD
jgi:hypothetical protein